MGMLNATSEPLDGYEHTFVNARKEASLYRGLQEEGMWPARKCMTAFCCSQKFL